MSSTVGSGKYGLKVGTPGIKSVGPLAFGPEGILFVADNLGATIFAIDVGDAGAASATGPIDVDNLDTRLAAYLGCSRDDVFIRDMALHPSSQEVYLSVMRGSGAAAVPILIKVGKDGTVSEVPLGDLPFSQAAIEDAPAEGDTRSDIRLVQGNREGEIMEPRPGFKLRVTRDQLRTITVTDMAYVDGVLLVAGASNEEFSSALRRFHSHSTGTRSRTRWRSTTSRTPGTRPPHPSEPSCRTAATRTCWQATPAPRWSTSR